MSRLYQLLKLDDRRYVIAVDDLAVARCFQVGRQSWMAEWIRPDETPGGWANGLTVFIRVGQTFQTAAFASPAAFLGHVIREGVPA